MATNTYETDGVATDAVDWTERNKRAGHVH